MLINLKFLNLNLIFFVSNENGGSRALSPFPPQTRLIENKDFGRNWINFHGFERNFNNC